MLHYHILEMQDFVIADISKMQTAMFVSFHPKNFLIVGSFSQSMLSRVPTDHPIILEYLKTAVHTGDVGYDSIHKKEIPKKKSKGSQRKRKTIVSIKSKKKKRRRLTQLIIEEESSEHTESLDHNEKECALNNEEDSANIGLKSIIVLEPIQTPLVSSHMESEA
ncbi:unnamed protein product [Lactuca virosa]|uniref:Uncharacterized protein n=1 Tax=Lactuca virosa TaxID=75947 RepID=A0AAU9P0J1_9ASTR|nr:unnamed protein product [Lactuca virosa]